MSDRDWNNSNDNDDRNQRDDRRGGGRGGNRDSGRSGGGRSGGGRSGGGRNWGRRPRSYYSDAMKRVMVMDYRDVESLKSFVTERGRIRPRRQTGLSAKEQHRVTRAIKRARHMGLLPYIGGSSNDN